MIRLDETRRNEAPTLTLSENEACLLAATRDLAETLGVEPKQVQRALAGVIRRRTDFERLRRSSKASPQIVLG